MKYFLAMWCLLLAAFVPFAVQAQEKAPISIGNPLSKDFQAGQLEGGAKERALKEDLVKFTQDRLASLVATMMLVLAAVAIVPVVVGGFQLIISQGGAYAEKGKKTLFWGVVGLSVGLTGYVFFGLLLSLILER